VRTIVGPLNATRAVERSAVIEVVSHPPNLAEWDPDTHPFYLEVYGETEPQIDMTYAEVVPAGGDAAKSEASTPIYEYWWTLGHAGTAPEHRHLWPERKDEKPIWKKLEKTAARIYLYFPIDSGWRIKELVATVKYLSPVADQKSWSEAASQEWSKIQPLMQGAGTLASTLAPIPGVGTVAAGAAPILSTLAKLQIGSVPQGVKGFEWSVGKVTFGSKRLHGVMQGVMWTLPKEMFELLGGRLTGSLAVSFIPSRKQTSDTTPWHPEPGPLLGHAVVYADDEKKWVPGSSSFVELTLKPQVRDTVLPAPSSPQPESPS
jgi:hypothetical protein